MSRLIKAAAMAAAVALGTGVPAGADTAGSATTDTGGVHSTANADTGRPGGGSSTGRPQCTYTALPIRTDFPVYDEDTGQLVQTDATGQWYEKWCEGVFHGTVWLSGQNPGDLLDQARRYLPLPLPEPMLSPTGDQLVNLSTWIWLADGWSTETSSVSVPGIAVTVTATPISAIWTMGDGQVVLCDGPGTAFNPSLPLSMQRPTCSHTYTRSSASQANRAYPVSVTVRWQATWDVSGAAGGGDLGTIERTTAFDVRVGERQAVNTSNS